MNKLSYKQEDLILETALEKWREKKLSSDGNI